MQELLIQQLRAMVKYHSQPKSIRMMWERIFQSFSAFLRPPNLSGIGYSASVWKLSSYATFRPITETKKVFISPALKNQYLKQSDLVNSDLVYFNLHGLQDHGEWYGQRDFLDPSGVDYPLALAPNDLEANGRAPKIVFTEACYGGHLFNKYESNSIGLKYLSLGVPVIIGSTCTSYGSISAPLIAADLLANLFWKNIREGNITGDALMRAKISLVQEMTNRQGYLDGEDQKTLIQFIYYGDPFFAYEPNNLANKRAPIVSRPAKVKTICDLEADTGSKINIDDDVIAQVKLKLKPYLPGIEQATVKLNKMQIGVDSNYKGLPSSNENIRLIKGKYVVTLQNLVQLGRKKYTHTARVTIDSKGKMIKMVVSK